MELTTAELSAIKPRTLNADGSLLTVSQWAEQNRVVNIGPRRGQWSNSVTPYLIEPMDTLTEPGVNEVILCFAPQTGKTQAGFNFLGYAVDQDPGPLMYVLPDEKSCRRMAKRRILPMLRTCPVTARQLPESGQDENIFNVSFRNGMDLFLAWASSASELASESIRYVVFDETDKYPPFSGKEADPISLGKARTITYGEDAKILYLSTPTTEAGAITRAMNDVADEVRRFMAVCPECGTAQQMDTGNIRWPEDVRDPRKILRKRLAWYVCLHCQVTWDDLQRDQAVKQGFWQADEQVERPRAVGFHLPSFYSPFVSLSQVAADFLRAELAREADTEEYLSRRMFFKTQHEATPWKEKKRSADLEEMRSYINPEILGGVAPAGTIAVTVAVDMQKDHFLYSVRACGRFEEESSRWQTVTIDYGRIENWEELETLFTETSYPISGSDKRMVPFRAALDTGGGESDSGMSRTEEAYTFLSRFTSGRVTGIKGASRKPARSISASRIDVLPQSGRNIKPQTLYLLDTEAFKDLLWERIQEGNHTFSADTGDDFLRQLLAEEKVLERGRYRWKQRGGRPNHYFDCETMQEAMSSSLWKPALQALRKPQGIVSMDGQPEQSPQQPKKQSTQKVRSGAGSRARPSWFHNR